ncbi:MAG: helicase [Caeruleum heppii]|nr:MAG: helicase [Caeruleum heppii]
MFDQPLLPGSTLSIAGKDVEIDQVLPRDSFPPQETPVTAPESTADTQVPTKRFGPVNRSTIAAKPSIQEISAEVFYRPVKRVPQSTKTAAGVSQHNFKNPLLTSTVMPKQSGDIPTPRHDPAQPGALVMKRPKNVSSRDQIVDVVVDPILCQHLREHQKEGVKFLYECVMGLRQFDGDGAILADEMGLGKTLQTIALLWTLLKQNPIHNAPPVIKKALIVCPVTLIDNWRKEFRKWLGRERIGVYVADATKTRLTDFTMGRSYSIMIIGYEKLRSVQDELKTGHGIDIVIADEGHRLKTAQNKSAQAIKSLNTSRRIILSGTPIQNDLSEFFMMVDFVNPGLLGTYNAFKKGFEAPILKSRQPNATRQVAETGKVKGEELSELTKPFILRRTAEILSKYLPPKTEYVLFCQPTTSQAQVYRAMLASPAFSNALGNPEASLQLITLLKKVCNSPSLLAGKSGGEGPTAAQTAAVLSDIPSSLIRGNPTGSSGKLRVLDRMLHHLRANTQEKVVIVSNYTSTLDLLQNHLASRGLPYLRLDGTTPSSRRQDLVDSFNRTTASRCFAFLLSAKAGGAGLNLIGASRLVLFELDWNPSTDLQAMARIHRDGQKRPVRIYRLLLGGALDEKVWQRQITKIGLADSVMDQKASASTFSREELQDLFKLDALSKCQTHDLLACSCNGKGVGGASVTTPPASTVEVDSDSTEEDLPGLPMLVKASQVNMEAQERSRGRSAWTRAKQHKMQALMQYAHIDTSDFGRSPVGEDDGIGDLEERQTMIDDEILMQVLQEEANRVKYVFARTSS